MPNTPGVCEKSVQRVFEGAEKSVQRVFEGAEKPRCTDFSQRVFSQATIHLDSPIKWRSIPLPSVVVGLPFRCLVQLPSEHRGRWQSSLATAASGV